MKSFINSASEATRRTFLKGMAAVGAAAVVTGCGSGSDDTVYYGGNDLNDVVPPVDLSNEQIYYAGCVHNCGTGIRCVARVHVANGRVVRITSDDSDYAYDGTYRDKEQYNDSRALMCPKGRSSKYKIYHSGRMRYVLKQTKERGDMSGFVRISLEQAMDEVARKMRAVYTKYGPAAIYNTYGSSHGYGNVLADCDLPRQALTSFIGGTQSTYSDYSYHQFYYGSVLTGHPLVDSPWMPQGGIGDSVPYIAGVVKNMVSWGTNVLSTNNSLAYPMIRAVEKMKERYSAAKVYFVGPEFVDTGVAYATDWVQVRNYTDVALVLAMLYHMIVNTFDAQGNLMSTPMLDVDYLDTMVYGFFDSPEYWVNTTDGTIELTQPSDLTYYRHIQAVPAGRSLSAYVMGSDDRLTKANYNMGSGGTPTNYTAGKFATKQAKRNGSVCSYNVEGRAANTFSSVADLAAATKYLYKKDFLTPKTPAWAEAICGTPVDAIIELAELYAKQENHPIYSEWSGGLQKQENGAVNIFAVSAMMCITKTFGMNGEGFYGCWGSTVPTQADATSLDYLDFSNWAPSGQPAMYSEKKYTPAISCKEWFNGIKLAYYDELKANGYTAQHIPDWDDGNRYVADDGGAKSLVTWKYNPDGSIKTYTDTDGKIYYDYVGRESNSVRYAGTRLIIQAAGGIQINQHMNCNDNAETLRCLKLSGSPTDADFADRFCFVQFDPFLSPSARFADYVIPAPVSLEAADWMAVGAQTTYRPALSTPPGETQNTWRMAYEAYKAHANLGNFDAGVLAGTADVIDTSDAHFKYVGTAGSSRSYVEAETYTLKVVDAAITDPNSRFYGMTREQVYSSQFLPRKNEPEPTVTAVYSVNSRGSQLRQNLNAYLSDPVARVSTPFVFNGINTSANAGVLPYGNSDADVARAASAAYGMPEFSGRFHVYNAAAVWEYENRFSKYHGWVKNGIRGQKNTDTAGIDPRVYPIPLYYNFKDCFNEMYGVYNLNNPKPDNDLSKKGGLTLSTTHDRYRVHSTQAESPFLREFNHRTAGGGYASGNDWNEYCVVPQRQPEGSTGAIPDMISTAILGKNRETASWHEIWINSEDAAERGITDGMLVRAHNPIGAVRVVARVTDRCVRGHANLHQGGWYDPNPVDGVDDGGSANTLMSSKPSRFDHGNSQQMAYVIIEPELNFFK